MWVKKVIHNTNELRRTCHDPKINQEAKLAKNSQKQNDLKAILELRENY